MSATADARGAAAAFLRGQYAAPQTRDTAEALGLVYVLSALSTGDERYTLDVLRGLGDAVAEQRDV